LSDQDIPDALGSLNASKFDVHTPSLGGAPSGLLAQQSSAAPPWPSQAQPSWVGPSNWPNSRIGSTDLGRCAAWAAQAVAAPGMQAPVSQGSALSL
jgi:hypothetical protein